MTIYETKRKSLLDELDEMRGIPVKQHTRQISKTQDELEFEMLDSAMEQSSARLDYIAGYIKQVQEKFYTLAQAAEYSKKEKKLYQRAKEALFNTMEAKKELSLGELFRLIDNIVKTDKDMFNSRARGYRKRRQLENELPRLYEEIVKEREIFRNMDYHFNKYLGQQLKVRNLEREYWGKALEFKLANIPLQFLEKNQYFGRFEFLEDILHATEAANEVLNRG